MAMWIGLADAQTGVGIDYGQFSASYANYGGGWYYVAIGSYSNVCARASGYNQACVNTDGYDSFRLYLTRPAAAGGSKK